VKKYSAKDLEELLKQWREEMEKQIEERNEQVKEEVKANFVKEWGDVKVN
jgi:replication-associated recombination protein RarA